MSCLTLGFTPIRLLIDVTTYGMECPPFYYGFDYLFTYLCYTNVAWEYISPTMFKIACTLVRKTS